MQKKPLVKLGFAVLIATATVFGINPAPARASDCPSGFGSCVMVGEGCDGDQCCCYYVDVNNPGSACPTWCN